MKPFRLSARLRFALIWPLLVALGVAPLLLHFLEPDVGRSALGWLALATVTALGPTWWWLNRWLYQPLRRTTDNAQRLTEGEIAGRVIVPKVAELAPLAHAINHLAAELEDRIHLLETERERFKEVTTRDMQEAQRLSEVRKDLVANVSHELKTPLTAIRGYAETLADGALERPQVATRFTRSILDQCARLEALLGDLLTLSRLESRQQNPPAMETLNLAQLARHAVEVLAPRARQRHIELTIEAPEDLFAVGEHNELERLLLNLIENAIKYNRPNGKVSVCLEAQDSDLLIEVRDTGIGIPEEALERIFERFYRVDKGRARDQGGTGLGLSIIKHVAQNHGGRIDVDSRLGEGSVFRVHLPRVGSSIHKVPSEKETSEC